jgi:hypothetical protein
MKKIFSKINNIREEAFQEGKLFFLTFSPLCTTFYGPNIEQLLGDTIGDVGFQGYSYGISSPQTNAQYVQPTLGNSYDSNK